MEIVGEPPLVSTPYPAFEEMVEPVRLPFVELRETPAAPLPETVVPPIEMVEPVAKMPVCALLWALAAAVVNALPER